jgi:DNA-binding NarL/FixJ family response regulator
MHAEPRTRPTGFGRSPSTVQHAGREPRDRNDAVTTATTGQAMTQQQMLAHQPGRQPLDIRTVLVCDDRKEMRDAITGMLELLPDLKLVGCAVDAHSCVAGVRDWLPDVLLLDVNIPGGGPNLAREVRTIHPTMHVVVFSGRDEPSVRQQMLAAGADQYVVKTGRLSPLLAALRRVGTEPSPPPSQLPAQRGPSPHRPSASGGAEGGSGPPPHPLTSSFVL